MGNLWDFALHCSCWAPSLKQCFRNWGILAQTRFFDTLFFDRSFKELRISGKASQTLKVSLLLLALLTEVVSHFLENELITWRSHNFPVFTCTFSSARGHWADLLRFMHWFYQEADLAIGNDGVVHFQVKYLRVSVVGGISKGFSFFAKKVQFLCDLVGVEPVCGCSGRGLNRCIGLQN